MTPSTRIPAIVAAAAACLGVSACGGDDTGDPIPAGKAERLTQRLDAIEQSIAEGCVSVAVELQAAHGTVATLDDDGVGEDVQDALTDGLDNLRDVAARECAAQIDDETTPETVPETVPETLPPPTETVPPPTETVPPPTETVPPEVPDEEESDEGDGGAQFEPDANIPPGQAKKDGEE